MDRKIFFVAACVMALAAPVVASAADQGNWYVGVDAGQAHYAGLAGQVAVPAGGTSHFSDNDLGYRLTGGYQFNEYWGLEASWVDLGTAEMDITATTPTPGTLNEKAKAHGFLVAGTGTWPFNDQWSAFLRFGMINGHVDVDAAGSGSLAADTGSQSSTDWKTIYGIGLNWNFYTNWIARIGWDQYRNLGNQNKTGEGNVNLVTIGIVYRF